MKIGTIFQKYGIYWQVVTITNDGNASFTWLEVTAVWSCFGPMPLWAEEPRTFYVERKAR